MNMSDTNVCKYCNRDNDVATEKCRNWLERCSLGDAESVYSSDSQISGVTDSTSNSGPENGFLFRDNHGIAVTENIEPLDEDQCVLKVENNKFENIQIYNSQKIHIGDVTYINGPVYLNSFPSPEIRYNKQDSFKIITRRNWLAQPPGEPFQRLEEPAKVVIICHSATEEAFTQAENTLLVRLIQTFHIESRNWNDIGYNFLVGADGNVYEGRGWDMIGAHTYGYNKGSVGIAFVGCYNSHLPPKVSIERTKALIAHGVKIGSIAEDYKLVGHCQCAPFESPGKCLYKEIQTWDHWDESVSLNDPVPLQNDCKNDY